MSLKMCTAQHNNLGVIVALCDSVANFVPGYSSLTNGTSSNVACGEMRANMAAASYGSPNTSIQTVVKTHDVDSNAK